MEDTQLYSIGQMVWLQKTVSTEGGVLLCISLLLIIGVTPITSF